MGEGLSTVPVPRISSREVCGKREDRNNSEGKRERVKEKGADRQRREESERKRDEGRE